MKYIMVKVKYYISYNISIWDVCDSFPEAIIVLFLNFLYYMGICIISAILFVTVPLWIIPYLIFKSKRSSKKIKEEIKK